MNRPTCHLGDATTADLGVGLAVTGSEPGPRAQSPGVGEPGHVTDLGHEHCGQHRTDPTDLLDHPISPMALQPAVDLPVELNDLPVIERQ